MGKIHNGPDHEKALSTLDKEGVLDTSLNGQQSRLGEGVRNSVAGVLKDSSGIEIPSFLSADHGLDYKALSEDEERAYGKFLDDVKKLNRLDLRTAQILAINANSIGGIRLDALTQLDSETAKVLGQYEGRFSFDCLAQIDIPTLKTLATFKCEDMDLGLTQIDLATAEILGRFKAFSLQLPYVTQIDAPAAKALSKFKGKLLTPYGLTQIDAATAEALVNFKGDVISLDSITGIDVSTARALAKFKGAVISIKGVTKIDSDVAEELMKTRIRFDLGDETIYGKNRMRPR